MDCSLPGSSVHGILQTVMLEWVAIPFSGDLLPAGIEPRSPTFQTFCTTEPPEKSMGPRSAFLAAGWNSAWFQLILAQKKKKKPSEVLTCLSWCFNGPDFSRGHLRRLLRTPWSHRCLYPRPPRPHCSLADGEWVPPQLSNFRVACHESSNFSWGGSLSRAGAGNQLESNRFRLGSWTGSGASLGPTGKPDRVPVHLQPGRVHFEASARELSFASRPSKQVNLVGK